jgi:hypothetical protein
MGLRSCVEPDGAFLAQPEHSINLRMCATHQRQRSPRSTMPIMCATLLVTELSPTFDRTLRELGKHARARAPTNHSQASKLACLLATIHSHVSISKHDSLLFYRQPTEIQIVTEIARDANFPRFDAAQGWGPWLWYQCDSAVAAPNLAPGFRPFRAC